MHCDKLLFGLVAIGSGVLVEQVLPRVDTIYSSSRVAIYIQAHRPHTHSHSSIHKILSQIKVFGKSFGRTTHARSYNGGPPSSRRAAHTRAENVGIQGASFPLFLSPHCRRRRGIVTLFHLVAATSLAHTHTHTRIHIRLEEVHTRTYTQ